MGPAWVVAVRWEGTVEREASWAWRWGTGGVCVWGEGRLTGAMAVQVKGDVGLRKSRPERGQGLRDDDDVRASYPKEPCC